LPTPPHRVAFSDIHMLEVGEYNVTIRAEIIQEKMTYLEGVIVMNCLASRFTHLVTARLGGIYIVVLM
jgi:hypothetical protein